jgi:putative membrane protein
MKLLIRIIITSVLVLLISNFMTGVHVAGFVTALLVAVVLGLLNIFIKPIFVLLTLPFTIFTLGLFLLVINAIIILLCTNIVGGFSVDSFWTALLFSVVLSLSQSILFAIVGKD